MRASLLAIISVISVWGFSANAKSGGSKIYLQAEANTVDVETDLSGAKIEGSGFGARLGYRWTSWGLEGGYTSASAKLKGQVFSSTDKYEEDFTIITAGARWWMARWIDLSFGALSVSGKTDMSITVPLLGNVQGDGKYSSSGYYLGLGINIPISMVDIFLGYNLYRWSEKEYSSGSLTGAKSNTGINTIGGGLRFNF